MENNSYFFNIQNQSEDILLEQLNSHIDELSYVDPQMKTNCAMAALHFEHFQLFENILDLHAKNPTLFDINQVDKYQKGLLLFALTSDTLKGLEILIKYQKKNKHLDVNLKNNQNKTALHHLLERIESNSLEKLKLFLTLDGLDVNSPDNLLQTPFHYLVNSSCTYASDEPVRLKVLKYLIQYQKSDTVHYDFNFAAQDEMALNPFMGICLRETYFKKMANLVLPHFELFDVLSLGSQNTKLNAMEFAVSDKKKFDYLLSHPVFQNVEYLNQVKDSLPLAYQKKIETQIVVIEKNNLNVLITDVDKKNKLKI
jgi:hypothetical protein